MIGSPVLRVVANRSVCLVEKPGQTLSLKGRVLQSAQIAVKAMGYQDHGIFAEEL